MIPLFLINSLKVWFPFVTIHTSILVRRHQKQAQIIVQWVWTYKAKPEKTLFDFYIWVPDIKQEPSSPAQDPEEAQQQSGGWARGGEGEARGKGDCLYEGRHGQRQTFKQDNRHQLRFATSVLSWDNLIIIRLGDGAGAIVKMENTGQHQDRGDQLWEFESYWETCCTHQILNMFERSN